MSGVKRCDWTVFTGAAGDPAYLKYHDEKWGKPTHDDRLLFEMLILESFQSGLSWKCILDKRENFRRAYSGFDVQKVAAYGDKEVEELMNDKGIIRNRRKIEASIINSRVFLDIQKEYGSFSEYLWGFTEGKIIYEPFYERTESPLSLAVSKDMKKRGMKFVGSVTVYSYLQSVGIINGHSPDCDFR